MQTFTEQALIVMKRIPPGKIMTYGQVAAAAGSPRAARQVTRILHSMSKKHNLPWHRVVNAQGQIVVRDEDSRLFQKTSLQREGVEVDESDRVDLNQFRFDPEKEE